MADEREKLNPTPTAPVDKSSKEARLAEIQKKINDLTAEREKIMKEE